MITQHYMIDLIPAGDPVVVHVSQYDKLARILAFDLYVGGVAFEPPAGATAQIRGTKPDGTIFNYAMAVDGITVSIPIPQQMALVAGDVPCEIQIVGDGGAQIGTANFLLKVERSALDEEAAESSSDIPLFEQLTQQAMEAASDAEASAEDAQAAQSAAESLIPGTGTVGQVLTKTATGTAWEDAHGGDVQTVDGFEPDTNGAVTTERVLTQAEYNALSEAEKNNGMTYYISDGAGGGSTTATQVSYSNTASGLSATNVQGAIDETNTVQAGTLTLIPSSLTRDNSTVERCGKNGILSLEIRQAAGLTADTWTQIYNSSILPTSAKYMMITNVSGTITINFTAAGVIQVYPHTNNNTQSIRAVIPFFVAD